VIIVQTRGGTMTWYKGCFLLCMFWVSFITLATSRFEHSIATLWKLN